MEHKYFTFIIVPHSPSSRTVSIKIPRWAVHLVVFIMVSSSVVFLSSVVYTSYMTRKLVSYETLKIETQTKDKRIQKLASQTDRLIRSLRELSEKENEIRKMLGLKKEPVGLVIDEKLKGQAPNTASRRIAVLGNELKRRHMSIERLSSEITLMRKRFAFTPSIWPAAGRVMSTFGYRIVPWRGFHSGIDICNSYGSPIRCTAAGTVSYTGWRQGYGKTVIVDHSGGISTLYGHCSGYAVAQGQRVKKGQLIAYIGTTGYTTGPHVHYEVRRNDVAINPAGYLNLTLFSGRMDR